ncbi:AMIN-like domain-containing (lipo)protein [Micromonospora pisi]|nr:hypothetical protein [Micromonospora pisi]
MTRQRVPMIFSAVVLLAAACSTAGPADPPGQPPATTAVGAGTPGTGPATTPSDPAASPDPPDPASPGPGVTDYRVTWNWGVPSEPVRIDNKVRPPVVPPPGPPLPLLVEVRVGDHPDEDFTRITFAFRNGTPGYQISYVPRVTMAGSGDPVKLPGNAFVYIEFNPAQAHDEQGRSSIVSAPDPGLGYPTLRGYGSAGDYEGHVSYGLGLQVPPGSDHALPIRALQLTRPDGTRIVAVDVRRR